METSNSVAIIGTIVPQENTDEEVTRFFQELHARAERIIFGDPDKTMKSVLVGYGSNGPTIRVAVPGNLRASILPQKITYTVRWNGRDGSVNVELVH